MSDKIIKKKVKTYTLKPFTFQYVEAITDDDIIKGGGLYFLKTCFLTIARCNNVWIDQDGKPYNFKKDGDVWFIRKFAISFK